MGAANLFMDYLYIYILITIACIWLMHIYYESHIIHNLLGGFWEADSSFCKESGLDMFCLYMDGNYNIFGTRGCYILATRDGEVIINTSSIATMTFNWFSAENIYLGFDGAKYLDIHFEELDEDIVEVFPKYQKIRFYPICNKIVLYKDDTITAVLYKNPVNTELKKVLDENE